MKLLIINQFRTRLKMAETATGCRIVPLPVILSSYRHPRLVRGFPPLGRFAKQLHSDRPYTALQGWSACAKALNRRVAHNKLPPTVLQMG